MSDKKKVNEDIIFPKPTPKPQPLPPKPQPKPEPGTKIPLLD